MQSIQAKTEANQQAIVVMQQTVDALAAQIGNLDDLQGPVNDNVLFSQSDSVLVATGTGRTALARGGGDIGPFAAAAPAQQTIVGAINRNTSAIAFNATQIQRNAAGIATNVNQIAQMGQQLQDLDLLLQSNSEKINQLNNGLAALAAMPDLSLSADENFAFSGRLSVYAGDLGFGLGMSLRADENWSLGLTAGHGGDQTTGAVQFRFAQ